MNSPFCQSSFELSAGSAFLGDSDQLPEQNSFLGEVNFTLRTVALLVPVSCLYPIGEVVSVCTVNLKDGRDKAK